MEDKGRASKEWVGSLDSVPLAEVIKRIALEERTGDLQVIFGAITKTVYFDRGFVVFAASNFEEDRLGHRLIHSGHISRDDFFRAHDQAKRGRQRLGQALVEAGVISEEEIGHQVAMQVNGIVVSLFELDQGIYSFDERPCGIPIDLMVSLSIHRILLEGIRKMPNSDGLVTYLPPLDAPVRVSERAPFTYTPEKLAPIEREVLGWVKSGTSLETVLRETPEARDGILRAFYSLYTSGILESGDGNTPDPPLKVQEETKTFRLSELERCLGKTQATSIQQEIRAMHESLEQTADDHLLQIDARSTVEGVEQAYRERCNEWSWVRSLVRDEPSLSGKIDDIETRLESAYRRALAQRTSSPAESQRTPGDLEDWSATDGVGAPLAAHRAPVRRNDPAPSKALPGRHHEGPTVASQRAIADAIRGEIRTRVKQILSDVERHSQAHDWEGAIALLFELVELVPQNPSYRAQLAGALSRHPLQRRQAERHYIEALRLAPQDAALHVSLGLYYKSFGLRSRAEIEFRTALRIDPEQAEARRQLAGDQNAKASWGELLNRMLSSAAG